MELERKKDLSVYYWLKSLFSDAPFITIVDGFPETEITLPTISVDFNIISTYVLELGSRDREHIGSWSIDIYAKNKAQRDEIGFRILSALDDKIPVYDYDAGFPPTVTPGQIGCLDPDNTSMQVIKVIPELVEALYYRSVVDFTAEYTQV
jgi:hypothetical protein